MHLNISGNLNTQKSLAYYKSICSNLDKDLYLDFDNTGIFSPFGMLVLGSAVRAVSQQKNVRFLNYEKKHYAANMGFFQSIGCDYGRKPGESLGNVNYLPVTQISISRFYDRAYERDEDINDVIENKAEELAFILTHGNTRIHSTVIYSMREMMRNVVEHSKSTNFWIAAQFWEKTNTVEVALLDEGIGIRSSLTQNGFITPKNDFDALSLALEPGVSRVIRKDGSIDPNSNNSGFGLYVTSNICMRTDGAFFISSGDSTLCKYQNSENRWDKGFKGTAVCLRVNISNLNDQHELLDKIVSEGENTAQKSGRPITKASIVSKSLSIKY